MRIQGQQWDLIGTVGGPQYTMKVYFVKARETIEGRGLDGGRRRHCTQILDKVRSYAEACRAAYRLYGLTIPRGGGDWSAKWTGRARHILEAIYGADSHLPLLEKTAKKWDGTWPAYCTQPVEGGCVQCSLTSYGRDCKNNPIEEGGEKTAHDSKTTAAIVSIRDLVRRARQEITAFEVTHHLEKVGAEWYNAWSECDDLVTSAADRLTFLLTLHPAGEITDRWE